MPFSCLACSAVELQGLGEAADMVGEKPGRRVDGHGEHFFGRGARHLLDVHAAFGGADEGDARRGPVDQAGQIELAGDIGAFLDIDAGHRQAFRPGLMGDELHAEHGLRRAADLFRRLGHLDAAALAAPAGVDLGLDHHDGRPELLGRLDRFFDRECRQPVPHRDIEGLQQRLGLVFMDVHASLPVPFSTRA
jgi:hypothetical protein